MIYKKEDNKTNSQHRIIRGKDYIKDCIEDIKNNNRNTNNKLNKCNKNSKKLRITK